MKPENKFRNWFIGQFRVWAEKEHPGCKVRVQKHADYATDGIPDIDLAIHGMTMWLEVKLLTSCQEVRKINVTPLQRANLEQSASAGVPAGLLIGLALGPRKGYRVAVFVPPLSEVAHRDMFRPVELACEKLYAMADEASSRSYARFNAPDPDARTIIFTSGPHGDDRDSATEDGG